MADQVPLILTAGQLSMLPSADILNTQAGVAFRKLASAPATPPSGYVRLYWKTDNKCYKKTDDGTETEVLIKGDTGAAGSNGTNGTNGSNGSSPSATCLTTSDTSSSSTTLVSVTGATLAVVSGTTYSFDFWVLIQSAVATAGVQLAVTGPTASIIAYSIFTPTSNTAYVQLAATAWDTKNGAGAVGVINTTYLSRVTGLVKQTANGNIQLRVASENTSTVKVMTGTCGLLWTM